MNSARRRIRVAGSMKEEAVLPRFPAIWLGGMAASVLVLWTTAQFGVGVSSDSITYIETAESLLAGKGFLPRGEPMTFFPPIYPLALAATGLLAKNLVEAARVLNALLFGINVTLIALAVYLSTARSFLAAVCAAFALGLSASILQIHSWAWSEPLFISFSLAGIIFLSMHAAAPRWHLLAASAISIGLASATRYVGIALLPSAALFLLVFGGRPMRYKVRDALLVLLLACAPLGIWFFHTAQTGSTTGRVFAVHLVSVQHVKNLVVTTSDLILPLPVSNWLKAGLLGLVTALAAATGVFFFDSYKERLRGIVSRHSLAALMPILCVLFSGAYVVFLFLSISFFDAGTPLDYRILSVVLVCLLVLGISLGWTVTRVLKRPGIRSCLLLLLLFSVTSNVFRAASFAMDTRRNGLGYSSRQWRSSECMAFVESLADSVNVYTNDTDAVMFLTHSRKVSMVPAKVVWHSRKPNGRFTEDLLAMAKDCRENGAILVITSAGMNARLLTPEELESICNLRVLRRLADGTVYGG